MIGSGEGFMVFGSIILWANTKVERSFGLTKGKIPKLRTMKSSIG